METDEMTTQNPHTQTARDLRSLEIRRILAQMKAASRRLIAQTEAAPA